MSRYSFIDENINTSGKQCFCIDVNSKNSPFIDVNTSINTLVNAPVTALVNAPVTAPLQNISKKTETYQMIKPEQNYLLTPQVINSSREKNMIDTINSLMTQTYSNISTQKDFQVSNAPTNNVSKISLTTVKKPDTKTKIKTKSQAKSILNTMANDTKVGKKTYRKSSSNLDLFEGFDDSSNPGGCDNVCKPLNKSKNNLHPYKSNSKSNTKSNYNTKPKSNYNTNDNMYLLIIILVFLLCSWFKK
jgi:hypothetical protein